MKVTFRSGSKRRSNNEKRRTKWLPTHFYELDRLIDRILSRKRTNAADVVLDQTIVLNNPIRTFGADTPIAPLSISSIGAFVEAISIYITFAEREV